VKQILKSITDLQTHMLIALHDHDL